MLTLGLRLNKEEEKQSHRGVSGTMQASVSLLPLRILGL